MKDALKRAAQAMGLVPAPAAATVVDVAPEAAVEVVEAVADAVAGVVVEADVDALQAELTQDVAGLQASVVAKTEELATLQALFEAQAAELETVKAALAAVTQTAEQAAAAAHVAEMVSRKEAVVAALGTERAGSFMVAVEGMDKATFTSVMAAMNAKAEVEADKPEFKEVGVDAQADVDALVAESETSGTLAILKAKYQQNAAN